MSMAPPPVDYLTCLFPPAPLEQAGVLQQDESCRSTTSIKPVATVAGRPRGQRGQKAAANKKGNYRHVPHKDKPPQMVARRNARERRRVQAVNTAFYRLRNAVPGDTAAARGKRVSKVKTLQRAIDYIYILQDLLTAADESSSQDYTPNSSLMHDSLASDGASVSSGNVSSTATCCWGDCNNCINCRNSNNYSLPGISGGILIESYQY